MIAWLRRSKRRIVQTVSLVALNFNFWAVASERFCLPVMNCEACALAWLGCPIGMLGRSLVLPAFPIVVFVSLLVATVLLGRLLCGWVCPLGFLQDILHKIPVKRFKLPRWTRFIKYAVLAVMVFGVPLWYGLGPVPGDQNGGDAAAIPDFANFDFANFDGDIVIPEPPHVHNPLFFCNQCPTAAMQVVIPAMIAERGIYLDQARTIRFLILAIVLLAAVGNHRSFCKVLCPIGALVAVGNKLSLHRIRLNPKTCIACRKCDKKCPMEVPVMRTKDTGRSVNRDPECIGCLTCETECPADAIGNNSRVLP